MMADCAVTRSDETVAQFLALNDFAITNGAVSRNFPVRCSTNECLIGEFEGNGVLVSTPTGCTAYSLAAGGPLVDPELDSLLLTPICPHTIGNRSIVLPGDTVISLTVLDDHESPVVLTVDGQTGTSLGSGETVVVSQAKYRARFVARSEEGFYSRVRRKFGWGTRYEAR
jgi:NAD+ kinase